jgi:hypothetical protein
VAQRQFVEVAMGMTKRMDEPLGSAGMRLLGLSAIDALLLAGPVCLAFGMAAALIVLGR